MKSARLLRRLRKQIKRSQTHILLAAALAALGACAPLAEVSKTEPKLGAQDGTIAELGVLGAMEHNPELWIMFHCSQNFYMASVLPTSAQRQFMRVVRGWDVCSRLGGVPDGGGLRTRRIGNRWW